MPVLYNELPDIYQLSIRGERNTIFDVPLIVLKYYKGGMQFVTKKKKNTFINEGIRGIPYVSLLINLFHLYKRKKKKMYVSFSTASKFQPK